MPARKGAEGGGLPQLQKNYSPGDKDVSAMHRMAKIRRNRLRENSPPQHRARQEELQSAIIHRLSRGKS